MHTYRLFWIFLWFADTGDDGVYYVRIPASIIIGFGSCRIAAAHGSSTFLVVSVVLAADKISFFVLCGLLLISLSLRSSLLSLLLLFSCPCGRVLVLPDVIAHSIKAGTVLLLLTTHNDKHTNTQTHKTCPVVLSCIGPIDKTSSPTTEGRQAIRHPKPADFARILGPIGQRRTAFRAPSLFLGGNWSLGTVTDDVTMTTT